MIARLLAALLLLSAAGVGYGALLALGAGRPEVALLLLLLPFALLASTFALEGLLLRRARVGDPSPEPTVGQIVRALIGEARAAIPRFYWHQAWAWSAEDAHLDAQRHAGRTGVLLVHGYFCNRGFWWNWTPRLRAADQPFIAVTLEPAFGDLDHTAPALDAAARRLHAATGKPILIVAHSMGGLAVRRWWSLHPETADAIVGQVVTIGSPHGGTALARLAHTVNGRQMRIDGPWLTGLARIEPARRAQRFLCFYGHCDNIVFPPARAQLPGADNRHLEGVAHVAMADHPAVTDAVQAALRAADAPRGAGAQDAGSENTRSDASP